MSRNKILKIAIAIGLVLMVAAVIWEGTTRYKLDKQIQIEKEEQLLRENARLRYIQQLSVEFSFDPRIVMTVDHLAGEYIKQGDLAYRLLTRELFTYLFLSLIFAESEGDATAIGDDGNAYGLTQLWLTSAKQYNENITIEGEVQGNLFGDERIVLRQSGVVRGDMRAPAINLEDGAKFKGNIDMDSKDEQQSPLKEVPVVQDRNVPTKS